MTRLTARKRVSVSLRMDSDLKTNLDNEATREKLNLSALVNQILQSYTSWGRYERMLGLIAVPKEFLREVFGALSKAQAEAIATRLGESLGREEVTVMFRQATPEAFLKWMELRSSRFEAYEHKKEGNRHFFMVRHDVDLNFSHFLYTFLSAALPIPLSGKLDLVSISSSSVTVALEA